MLKKRKTEEKIFKTIMIFCTLLIIIILFLILISILLRGFSSLNFAMITQTPKGGYYLGKEGGILNAILGSICLAGGATLLAMCISIPVAAYLTVFKQKGKFLPFMTRFALDVLWGIPSIVYGAFAFIVMLFLGLKASLLSGIIAIALVELPIMTRSIDEVMKSVPEELKEASLALGANELETTYVAIKQCTPGIVTSVLIAFGRGIGDAAAVMFTAGFSDYLPTSLFDPVATLPLAIFFQLNTPFVEVQNRAYASAFVLTMIILMTCWLSRILTKWFDKFIIK